MMLWSSSPEGAREQMLPSGVERNMAVLPTLPLNTLPDPLQKAFLGSRHLQPLFVEGGAGPGILSFLLCKSTLKSSACISFNPSLLLSIPVPSGLVKEEIEWVQHCC